MSRNPQELTCKVFHVGGTGSVLVRNSEIADVIVEAYFCMWDRWWFMIHHDLTDKDLLRVSEASCGCLLNGDYYETVEDALYFAVPFCEKKHYYFHTSVMGILVKTQKNLQRRNTHGLFTPAIQTALL